MEYPRKICPICKQHCVIDTIILLTNNRACHEDCVLELWDEITAIHDKSTKAKSLEFPKKYIQLQLEKSYSAAIQAIKDKTTNTGFFSILFSSTYKNEMGMLEANKTKISKDIELLRKEEQNFKVSTEKQSVEILKNADALYQSLKPIFDFWPTYPPDWDWRRNNKRKNIKRCPKCNSNEILHIHHKVPISEGGNHKATNLEVICGKCHMKEHGVEKFSKTKDTFTRQRTIQNTDLIKKAIQHRTSIQFRYKKFDGETSFRKIDPHEIILVKNTKCVRGYCHLRNEDRSFAIRKITDLKLYTTS
jgi:hypothetical protein